MTTSTAFPVGETVDTKMARVPGSATLQGRFGSLVRLSPHHAPSLWHALRGHDDLWIYTPDGPFADEMSFSTWIEALLKDGEVFGYAVVSPDGHAIGMISLINMRPKMRTVEVARVVLSPALQRTALATEAQFLLARYAFEDLGFRRYEWKCHSLNAASRRAAERFGFTFEGIFRQHMILKGRNRDTAWFSMLDGEWPARKAAFESWLSPDNFDAGGQQRRALGDFTRAAT